MISHLSLSLSLLVFVSISPCEFYNCSWYRMHTVLVLTPCLLEKYPPSPGAVAGIVLRANAGGEYPLPGCSKRMPGRSPNLQGCHSPGSHIEPNLGGHAVPSTASPWSLPSVVGTVLGRTASSGGVVGILSPGESCAGLDDGTGTRNSHAPVGVVGIVLGRTDAGRGRRATTGPRVDDGDSSSSWTSLLAAFRVPLRHLFLWFIFCSTIAAIAAIAVFRPYSG